MGLFGPKWKSSNKKDIDKAIAEVRTVTDQQKLKQIALEAYFPNVREEALTRISDPALLKDLILTGEYGLAIEALKRLDDQGMLKEIALGGSEYALRAVERITDPVILAEIIGSDANIRSIQQAIRQIEDARVLNKAFHESKRLDVQRELWKRLPQEEARQIAREWNVAAEAMCAKMGAHCNAPGPVSSYVEENFDEGFTDHEVIHCELCGNRMRHRSKPTTKGYSWGPWEEVDPQ